MSHFLVSTLLSAALGSAQGVQSLAAFSGVNARITNIPAGYCDALMVQILPGESYAYEAEPSGVIRGSIKTEYDMQILEFAMSEGGADGDWPWEKASGGGVTVTVWMPRDALRKVEVAQKNSLRIGGPGANGTFASTAFAFNALDQGQLLVEDFCADSISSADFNSASHSQIALTDECGDIRIEGFSANSGAMVAITSDATVHGGSWGANSGAHVSLEGSPGSTVERLNINSGAQFLMKGVTVTEQLNANSGAHWSTVDGSVQNQNVNSGAGPMYTFDAATSVSADGLTPHPSNKNCNYEQWVVANLWWMITVLVSAVLLACVCLCTCICVCCRGRRNPQPPATTVVYATTPEATQQPAGGAPKYDGAVTMV